ncbi:enoyl-CoA hydratase-related protein [Bradyrhizobium sp. CCGUVB14]|uniref:enoyl-CoA hydratase-related protein n=1 Tax=Bradyrhizobium sp. CCGUVB14 TaxID=2949628 RepID=UPI0020B1F9E2|nr:enoyl-CoA hydratase-related protein [Bradyrhizobium sp. CCGUVB14]MCP3440740.1 enoyl-CoA hydratase-related protein [Bradyrhizobium sp. CCGUVB14]
MISEYMQDGILIATIDMPGRSMNVFSNALMYEFEVVIDRANRDRDVRGLIVTSGKSSFLAGADLEMARAYTKLGLTADRDELQAVCGRLGRLFLRLETLPKPTIAALNGLALGGGLEVAMACRWRIVADDPRVQLGLPEIKLGLMPGGGGTQRLPRLIGIERGLELLLNGSSVGPDEAKLLGLVDQIVAKDNLIDIAVAFTEQASRRQLPSKFAPRLQPGPFNLEDADIVRQITRHYGHGDDVTADYPAYDAIVRSVVEARDLTVEEGTRVELSHVVELIQDPVAGNMVSTLFLSRQRASKLLAGAATITRFAVEGTDAGAQALCADLRASGASVVDLCQSQPSDVRIVSGSYRTENEADLKILNAAQDRREHFIGVHSASSSEYGRALEIIATPGDDRIGKALALAKQLRATPYIHDGERSLLAILALIKDRGITENFPRLLILAAQALAANRREARNEVGDASLADVACVVGGVFPAYSGGPLTWWSSEGPLAPDILRSVDGFLSGGWLPEE